MHTHTSQTTALDPRTFSELERLQRENAALRQHKEWADARIVKLIGQMVARERPLKERLDALEAENAKMAAQLSTVAREKGGLERRLEARVAFFCILCFLFVFFLNVSFVG